MLVISAKYWCTWSSSSKCKWLYIFIYHTDDLMLENSASKMQEQIYGIFFHRLLKTHNEFIYLRKYEAWLNWEKKLHLNVLLTRCPPVNDNICSFSGLLLQGFFYTNCNGGPFWEAVSSYVRFVHHDFSLRNTTFSWCIFGWSFGHQLYVWNHVKFLW